jgi:hypothetical protein
MGHDFAVSISGRIIAEFEDDARGVLAGGPEFVPLISRSPVVEPLDPAVPDLTPPSEL